MNYQRLKILFDIFLENEGDEDDIRASFISNGEDPDEIIERAANFVKKKEADIKLKMGRNKQNKASEFLNNLSNGFLDKSNDPGMLNDLGFAFRKHNADAEENVEELNIQANKIKQLKKFMDEDDEHSGKS